MQFYKMNLAIDIGNSRVKTGIFDKDKLLKSNIFTSFKLADLKTILSENPKINHAILCSVKKYPSAIKLYLSNHCHFTELTYKTPVPVKLAYKTLQTLGMDRLAAICGAFSKFKGKNILVVNAGTCITYDFLDHKEVFRGGSISPGLDMRYKALHTFTGGLPLIGADINYKKITGLTTEEAIRSGVQIGISMEVEGIIKEYQSRYKDLTVIITGGSMEWLLKSLKIKIKGDPFLLLTGLNVILSSF